MKIREKVELLKRAGIDISDFEIDVLGHLYEAAGGFSNWVTPIQVWKQVTSREVKPKPISRAWVYKTLKELSEKGFISVDRIRRPLKYMVTIESVEEGIRRKVDEKRAYLSERKEALSEESTRLKTFETKELASEIMSVLKGEVLGTKSGVVEGIDNVRAVIDQEIINRAQPGDVIWTTAPISIMEGAPFSSTTDRKLIESVFRGIKMKGLLIMTGESGATDLSIITDYMQNMVELFQKAAEGENLEIRVLPPGVRTYRLLGLNKERVMMYLTDVAQADTASLIRYEDNPTFIDDAVKTFENLWEQSEDFVDVITGYLEEMKKPP